MLLFVTISMLFPDENNTLKLNCPCAEPIVGTLRHPKICEKAAEWLMDPDTFIPFSFAHPSVNTSSNAFAFLAGANLYHHQDGAANSPGHKWFIETYQDRGIEWTRLVLWDERNPRDIYGQLPPNIIPRYTYFTKMISAADGDGMNPFTFMEAVARREDFVVLMIDTNSDELADQLVAILRSDSSQLELIDEVLVGRLV